MRPPKNDMVNLPGSISRRKARMKPILAIDPGGTTGIAIKLPTGDYHTCVVNENSEVYEFVVKYNYDKVLVEQFATNNVISKYGLRTAELVGGIEALCWLRKIELVRRMPQHRVICLKQAAIMLKDVPALMDHQIDSLAHLLAYERMHAA